MKAVGWRAPLEDGGVLIEPSPPDWPKCVQTNAQSLQLAEARFCGISLADWRKETRQLALRLAATQLARWGLVADWPDAGLLVSGHQPELFHPGVWTKCFAIAEAARKISLVSLNLIADHDQPKPLAIRVPVRTDHGLSAVWIPFCDASPLLAWEEYTVDQAGTETLRTACSVIGAGQDSRQRDSAENICEKQQFFSFAERVVQTSSELLPGMILPNFWSLTLELATRLGPQVCLAEILSGARRLWGQRWGYHNAELRVSALADTEPFHAFVTAVLNQLPNVVQHHNAELYAFRKENRMRSRSHPVPPLQTAEDWYESPFWVWTRGQPRQRLWWSEKNDGWLLRLGETGPILHVRSVRRREDLPVWRQMLQEAGWKIRPRALTLTLFARLFLAEMFVHGIGGGIYDRFTDRLLWRVWGIKPPQYAVVSATLRLLLPLPTPPLGNRAELLQRLRDCRFNPDRVLPREVLALPEVQLLVVRKQTLVLDWAQASREQRPFLHRQLSEIRETLQPMARSAEADLRQRLEALVAYQTQQALALDREWAFVLYSDAALTRLVERVRDAFAALADA